MKRHLLKFFALIICLHGLAWTHGDEVVAARTAGSVVDHLHDGLSAKLPRKVAQKAISELYVKDQTILLKYAQVWLLIEWVGKDNVLFKLNGRSFTKSDLQTEKIFFDRLRSRFGLRPKVLRQVGLLSFIFPQAHAETTDVDFSFFEDGPAESSEGASADSESSDDVVFEGIETTDFNAHLKSDSVFPEGASLANTATDRRFQVVYDLMTGENQLGMVKFLYMFLGGLQFATNPAGGFTPGMGFINDVGVDPSSVPFPY